MRYYTSIIDENPNLKSAGVFSDTGTGRNTKAKPAFRELLKLCRKRKVDLILTKSVSRFGRNTLDALKAMRELRTLGIDVWFEMEEIRLLQEESQFMLETFSAFAQSESKSRSNDIKWGLQRSFRQLDSKTSHFVCYGYTHDISGTSFIKNSQHPNVDSLPDGITEDGGILLSAVHAPGAVTYIGFEVKVNDAPTESLVNTSIVRTSIGQVVNEPTISFKYISSDNEMATYIYNGDVITNNVQGDNNGVISGVIVGVIVGLILLIVKATCSFFSHIFKNFKRKRTLPVDELKDIAKLYCVDTESPDDDS